MNCSIKVTITRLLDNSFPGYVEFMFIDALGEEVLFEEKVPVITEEILNKDSDFPMDALLKAKFVKVRVDGSGKKIFRVSTEEPWGIYSKSGDCEFDVLSSRIVNLDNGAEPVAGGDATRWRS